MNTIKIIWTSFLSIIFMSRASWVKALEKLTAGFFIALLALAIGSLIWAIIKEYVNLNLMPW